MSDELLNIYWKLSINGMEIDKKRRECIQSMDFEEVCNGSNTLTIKIIDPEFYYIEDNIFIEESTIQAVIGWFEDTHRITFKGYISAIDIVFPESGSPELSVFCLDNTHIMNRKKKKRSWDSVTNANVVTAIAKEYGFKCVTEPGYEFKLEETISQSDATDIDFIESLAGNERLPFMCKLIGDTIYYVKMGVIKNPVASFMYKKYPYDVVSFSPKINKETRQEEITKADINTYDKSTDSAVANTSNTAREIAGEPVKTSATPAKVTIYNPLTQKWEVK